MATLRLNDRRINALKPPCEKNRATLIATMWPGRSIRPR